MKYIIIAIVIIALVLAGYWAGTQNGDDAEATKTPTPAVSPTAIITVTSQPSATSVPGTPLASPSGAVVGNRVGNRAPDFQLKSIDGKNVALRDYLGSQAITLVFTVSGRVTMQTAGQEMTLQDPEGTVQRLYGVTSLPYTVTIDAYGIIR